MHVDDWIKKVSGGKSRISKKEENRLFGLYKNGTEKEKDYAQTELIAYNALPIVNIALDVYHSFPNGHKTDLMDLVQTGIEKFIKILPNFKPAKARLITFYSRDLKTAMQRYVMRYSTSIAQGSVYLQHLAGKRAKVRADLEQELKRAPTDAEIATAMEISLRTLSSIEKYTSIAVAHIPGLEYTNFGDGQKTTFDQIMNILRERFSFLDDDEYNQLLTDLYFSDLPNEQTVEKILNREGKTNGHNRPADAALTGIFEQSGNPS
ncbi:sigma-70 family RNA polymerase sigma factor [Acinetobacter sp.]|uniref:sigma-70 family RNA polymerase sigma factor n=1 Tax=Acinetobacter sp. TaxID=472 RepID=UPI003D0516E0